MELWIRSQDKLKMFKVDYLEYDFTKIKDVSGVITEYHKIIVSYNNDWFPIGYYATKERALEVLDEIQDRMLNSAFAKKINGLGEELDLIPNTILIYQMPEK